MLPNPHPHPWTLDPQAALDHYTSTGRDGLIVTDITARREKFGQNLLRQSEPAKAWLILVTQFRSLIVVLLASAAIVSFAFQDWLEGFAILAVLLINALIGFFTEIRAVRSMEALRKLTETHVTVRREGKVSRLAAIDLVPGDIVLLEAGDRIAADIRLIEISRLQCDESSLTGESIPVDKVTDALPENTLLADRTNMIFKGTSVTRGTGVGLVTGTGMDSEIGRITALVDQAKDEITPLEKRLNILARKLVWVTLALALMIAISGIISGKDTYLMIQTAIALAVAAIPEGLPIVATIALARGMWLMARRNALINRLSAVETLGATSVICTDKTGTLTENKMSVEELDLPDGHHQIVASDSSPLFRNTLECAALCNSASLEKNDAAGVGDPLEIALLAAADRTALDRGELLQLWPTHSIHAFDSEVKMMATVHADDDRFRYCVKGAAENIIAASTLPPNEQQRWLEENDTFAARGYRVLGVAQKSSNSPDDAPYEDLEFLGLIGMIDPPRKDVAEAIHDCLDAGIRVIMVTGDQPATARCIASDVGLVEKGSSPEIVTGANIKPLAEMTPEERDRFCKVPIFARVSPEQKLDLIEAHQRAGHIVAMTGDGVNDAPALREADIGIAMGKRGTDVAREAVDMILKDDAFSSIVAAIRQGRIIFSNIRRFVIYLMSCNLSEILVVALATAINSPLPILPLQILFLNVVTDVFPALALGMGAGHGDVMKERPRAASASILDRRHWWEIITFGGVIATAVMVVFFIALQVLKLETHAAVTTAFLTLACAQLIHVFNMREATESIFNNQITRNPYIWGAVAICISLLALAVLFPPMANILGLRLPGWPAIGLVLAGTAAPFVFGMPLLRVLRK